jgi:putative endonuclease
MTNFNNTVFYIGVTNDLYRRILDHRNHRNQKSFSARYQIKKLVYYEHYENINDAIDRETQIKKWHRGWKINLIRTMNPHLKELSRDWEEFSTSPK